MYNRIEWSAWESLGKPPETEIGRPCAQRNQDGRLEVFVIGLGAIFNLSQVSPGAAWRRAWLGQNRPSPDVCLRAHAIGSNADGRQEIFAIGDDNALWQKWQVTPSNGWSQWNALGAPAKGTSLTDNFTIGRNRDGRQEVFAIGSDGNIWQIWQTAPNGSWSNWGKLGKPTAGIRRSDRITVRSNLDRRQELFVMGEDDALWHIWQLEPNAGWSDWESLGKPKDRDFSEPLAHRNADGCLEVLASGNGALWYRSQQEPNSNIWRDQGWIKKTKPQPADTRTSFEAALNFKRELEVFVLGDDNALWHTWQMDKALTWSDWESLGNPPVNVRAADHLAVGTNQDGRLEVFVMGQDGAIWHIWQTRRSVSSLRGRTRPKPRTLLLTIDRATDRRALSIDQLRAEHLDFEIVDGVDGRLSLPLPRMGTWSMSNTELGCYYTHCRAYRRILDYGWTHGLLLEDDFRLLEFGRLGAILEELPPDCDFLALHRSQLPNDPGRVHTPGEKFNRLRPCALWLPGYVISSDLAAHVLSVYPLPDKPIDLLFSHISMDLTFGFYELARPIIGITGLASTISM
jgi:hypothetical protein